MERARTFDPLLISNDESLISAIEQTYDEFEEDEQVRELAVRVLAAFKTRNSVEALSQVALYDLSSNVRSKAVAILADYDHESVFETILSACADPTREVKAAAARALFKVSFDRSDAWTRISESGDTYKMKHAARAAIAGGLLERSFDRLIHQDSKVVYEAVALVALLINAGETDEIFKAIEYHRHTGVKLALLHVIKVLKNEETLSGLYSLLEVGNLPTDIKEAVQAPVTQLARLLMVVDLVAEPECEGRRVVAPRVEVSRIRTARQGGGHKHGSEAVHGRLLETRSRIVCLAASGSLRQIKA